MIGFIEPITFLGGSDQPLPDPTTALFTGAQYLPGITGSVSTTKNPERIYMRGALSLWAGFITGTEAKITTPSDFGDNPGGVQVSIDGGDFSNAPNVGSVYTLFTGLPHASHFVEVRYHEQLAEAPYVSANGTVLEVTGQPPSITPLSQKIQNGADSATGFYSGAQTENSATFMPALQGQNGQDYGSNVGSVKIRGAFKNLVVTLNGLARIGVSKNGAAPTFYDAEDQSGLPIRAMRVPCDGSLSTYYVWDNGNGRTGGGHLAVAGDAPLQNVGLRRRLDQYGDSITFGEGPGATCRDVETMRVAASMGFVGSTCGISGLTIIGLKALLDRVLPARIVSTEDVAVLAIGGNSVGNGLDAQDYIDCIDKLLVAGYGTVLCRGILNNASAQPEVDAANAVLKAAMESKADTRLKWIDPKTWTFSTQDGTHPDAAGYASLAGFALPVYAAALA